LVLEAFKMIWLNENAFGLFSLFGVHG